MSEPRQTLHPPLVDLLQRAYSAERAAAFAYIGHAGSLRDPAAKAAVKQIEDDEWAHRRHVLAIMQQHGVPVSRYYEMRFWIIGKLIAGSCHVIGWFMPYFFAGRLESGNVCEYFVIMHYFHALGIREHDAILYEMGMKEKEHEVYFLEQIKTSRLLPFFEKVFSWGRKTTFNDVDLQQKYPIEDSHRYCTTYRAGRTSAANPDRTR
ncbi:MAG: ferritin-like domain-containing protein [Opitutaceae bacterium]